MGRALGPAPERALAQPSEPVLDPETEAEIERLLAEIARTDDSPRVRRAAVERIKSDDATMPMLLQSSDADALKLIDDLSFSGPALGVNFRF